MINGHHYKLCFIYRPAGLSYKLDLHRGKNVSHFAQYDMYLNKSAAMSCVSILAVVFFVLARVLLPKPTPEEKYIFELAIKS